MLCPICRVRERTSYYDKSNKRDRLRNTCGDRLCIRQKRFNAGEYEWRPDPEVMAQHRAAMVRRDYLLKLRDAWVA